MSINLKKFSSSIILCFLLALPWTLKTLLFVRETGLEPSYILIYISSLGFAAIVASLLFLNRRFAAVASAFTVYAAASLLLYADVMYQRYYNAILRIELLAQASQLKDIKSSIISLINWWDFLYWVDLPVAAVVFFFFAKKISPGQWKKTGLSFLSAGMALILAISLLAFKFTYSDQYKISLAGIIPAHVYDLGWNVYKKAYFKQALLQKKSIEEIRYTFKNRQEIQKTSPYFGKFKGKNIIMIQAESLNTFPIGLRVGGEEVTPNLNNLIKESHYYPNTYLQIGRGNTSDAEFVANNSLYPMGYIGAYKGYPNNQYLSLPDVLNHNGYSTSVTHGNTPEFWNRQTAYKSQGYGEFYYRGHPAIQEDEIIGLGISDKSIFHQMARMYKKENKPFFNFIVSLTSHRPFILDEKYHYLDLPSRLDGKATGNYLQSIRYFDEALGEFIAELKAENIWEDSIFVVYGDHYGPLPADEEEIRNLLGVNFDLKTMFNIPLIIHHPGQTESVVNEGTGSQMDIYPTLTALLGIDDQLVQLGTTLDANHKRITGFAFETTRYSFFSDDYDYLASHEGVFEKGICIDNRTRKKTDVQLCREGYDSIYKDIRISTLLLENDYIGRIFNSGTVRAAGKSK
ncbi:LTA synthase family protein [Bacillus sp. FJAT-27445]|uniref:LTA synthase family protein n=1 Tax=Bacillus sp. FJAT-27445 TaxID=1679166 RepID=UPI000743CDE5|nr:LTA synthase family protein [Bacillus sp. FJAT-27445]